MKETLILDKVSFCTKKDNEILASELKKRKIDYHKAQYLRGVAFELIKSENPDLQKKGACILKKAIEEFPNEKYIIMTCHLILGKYYRSISDYNNAIYHFEIVMNNNHSSRNPRVGIGRPEMEIALTIIVSNHVENYDYAKQVMSFVDPRTLFVEGEKKQYSFIMEELSK